jgi:uncharacterized membrane protein
VPEDETIEADLTVEEAFKLVMSAGLVLPEKDIASREAEQAPTQSIARSQ